MSILLELKKKEGMGDTTANVTDLGRDLLFVLMWIGAWGTLELAVQWLSTNQRIQLVLYACLFIAGFVALVFVDAPSTPGKTGATSPLLDDPPKKSRLHQMMH